MDQELITSLFSHPSLTVVMAESPLSTGQVEPPKLGSPRLPGSKLILAHCPLFPLPPSTPCQFCRLPLTARQKSGQKVKGFFFKNYQLNSAAFFKNTLWVIAKHHRLLNRSVTVTSTCGNRTFFRSPWVRVKLYAGASAQSNVDSLTPCI